jgi:poly-beta-1,6-N-acetyl-D-glucosamine synthase
MILLLLLNVRQREGNQLFILVMSYGMILVAGIWFSKYVVYLLLSPWYEFSVIHIKQRLHRQQMQQTYYNPLVSVILPAWNEEVGLVNTIKTVLANNYRPMEIVIVNDGSTDKSDEVMRAFIRKYDRAMLGTSQYIPMLYHYQPNGGKGSALNTGIRLARGEILVSFDADCAVHEDCITHFVSCFTNPAVMAVAGNIKIGNTRNIIGVIQSLEYIFGFHLKKAEALLGTVFVIGGAASAFRKEVFTRIGGYNPRMITEDMDISLRIQEAGMKVAYAPEAIVHTEGASNLRGLFKQRLRWKRGVIEALIFHRSSFFRPDKGLNKLFFWVALPLVVVEHATLSLGLIFAISLYLYTFLFHDVTMLLVTVFMVTITFCIIFTGDEHYRKPSYLLLAPILWYLFHITAFVEVFSQFIAIWTLYRKRDVRWQKWQRKGVVD